MKVENGLDTVLSRLTNKASIQSEARKAKSKSLS